MAHTYSHLYRIPTTGLGFFTVYGPMGRPDMAYFAFTNKYFNDEPIRIYNNGDFEHDLYRDFTYIDDVVEGVIRLLNYPPSETNEVTCHRVFNIGNNSPSETDDLYWKIGESASKALRRKVVFEKIFEPMKPGDVLATYASTDLLQQAVGFKPNTSLEEGLQKFADWYVKYYKVKKWYEFGAYENSVIGKAHNGIFDELMKHITRMSGQ